MGSDVAHRLGTVIDADTRGFEEGTKRVRREAKKTEKSLFEVGSSGAKAAAVGGAAFSSLGAGISLATASAEGLEGALASASGSIVAAFGAGGPVGGAIAIATLGIGTMIRGVDIFGVQAEIAAKKAEEAFAASLKKIDDDVDALNKRIRKGELEGVAASVGLPVGVVEDRFALETQLTKAQARVTQITREFGDKPGVRNIRALKGDIAARDAINRLSRGELAKQERLIAAAERILAALPQIKLGVNSSSFTEEPIFTRTFDVIRGSSRGREDALGGSTSALIITLKQIEKNTRDRTPRAGR